MKGAIDLRVWEGDREREAGKPGAGAKVRDATGQTHFVELEGDKRVRDVHIHGRFGGADGRMRVWLGR